MAGKKAAAVKKPDQPNGRKEELVEEETNGAWEDDSAPEIDPKTGLKLGMRLRDWRDVERYREMQDLRDMVDDIGAEEMVIRPPPPQPLPKPVVKPVKAAKTAPKPAPVEVKKAAPPPVPAKPAPAAPAPAKPKTALNPKKPAPKAKPKAKKR